MGKEVLTTEQLDKANASALSVMESELVRIFGEEGVRNLIKKRINYLEKVIIEDTDEEEFIDSSIAMRDSLIDYLKLFNDEVLPF